jgi:hypothetical protein
MRHLLWKTQSKLRHAYQDLDSPVFTCHIFSSAASTRSLTAVAESFLYCSDGCWKQMSTKTPENASPVIIATAYVRVCVSFMCVCGCVIAFSMYQKGFTALHIAAKYGHLRTARLLLKRGVDPNVEGRNGLTPLHVATHYSHIAVALMLMENGANPCCAAKVRRSLCVGSFAASEFLTTADVNYITL